jgi:lauroyl/myristoyl acyltransferase
METSTNRIATRTSPFSEGLLPALVYFAYRAAAFAAERIPLTWGNRLAEWGGAIAFRLSSRKRATVARNMTRVLGSDFQIDAVVRAAFKSYARYWLETFRLGRYSKEELAKMVTCESLDVIDEALSHGGGFVLATAHFGFYDIGVAWLGVLGYPFVTVGEVLKPRALFEWFSKQRAKRGMTVIPSKPRDEARAAMFEALKEGKGVALLSDRDLGRRGTWVEFFGERTTFPVSPALLVRSAKTPLVGGIIYQVGENKYRVDFHRIPYEVAGDERTDVTDIAQLIASEIEGMIRKAPEQWHLFVTNWPSDEPHLPPRGANA